MTASECVGALRYALWHILCLRGLSWLDRLKMGMLKFVAIAGYNYGKWRTLGVAPSRRPDAEVSRRGLDPLIIRALKGCAAASPFYMTQFEMSTFGENFTEKRMVRIWRTHGGDAASHRAPLAFGNEPCPFAVKLLISAMPFKTFLAVVGELSDGPWWGIGSSINLGMYIQ